VRDGVADLLAKCRDINLCHIVSVFRLNNYSKKLIV
jgi:hypothetical protein